MASIDTLRLEQENQIIISKQLLSDDECDELIDLYTRAEKSDVDTLGCRIYVKTIIPKYIRDKIFALLSNYVVITEPEYDCTIYYTVGGEIKEHTDRIVYNSDLKKYSKYTLIIYLSSTEDDSGLTRIRRDKLYHFDDDKTELKHERHWIKPIKGNCVLFNSTLSHNSSESYGDKYILVAKIY